MIKERARYPRLYGRLDPQTPLCDLHPTAFTITEKASPLGYGSITIADDERIMQVGEFVEPFDLTGSLGRYQIVSISRTFRGKPVQVCKLEHALGTLERNLIFGELKYEDGQTTALAILQALLNRQSQRRWQLDRSDATAIAYLESQKVAMDFSDKNLLNAVIDFCDYLSKDLYIACDFSTYPWSLVPKEIVTKNEECELRLSRNVENINVKTDWSTLVTRLYPKGNEGITVETVNPTKQKYIDSDTVNDYGIVEGTWTEDSAKNASNLFTIAKKHLETVKDPGVTITADAYDFYKATGELYDHFVCGERCRVCLPEERLTMTYRINELNHKDLVNAPGKVTLSMGNMEQRRISVNRAKNGGGGGRGGSTEEPVERTWDGSVRIFADSEQQFYYIDVYVYDEDMIELQSATLSINMLPEFNAFDYQIGSYTPYVPGQVPTWHYRVDDVICTGAVANGKTTRIYIKAWDLWNTSSAVFTAKIKVKYTIKKI